MFLGALSLPVRVLVKPWRSTTGQLMLHFPTKASRLKINSTSHKAVVVLSSIGFRSMEVPRRLQFAIRRYRLDQRRVLDLGCGPGLYLRPARGPIRGARRSLRRSGSGVRDPGDARV